VAGRILPSTCGADMSKLFIISGTSWTVPTDWNSTDNSIETIGAGGGGQTATTSYAGSGGGGGAYSKIINTPLTSGTAISLQVGTGGSAGAAGGATWFNGTSFAASSVGSAGGVGGANNLGGVGGAAASGIGATKFSGGNGAAVGGINPYGGGGGGGAGGPNGNGGAGGSPNNIITSGAGGDGGNGSGAAGSNGDGSTGNGGSGGNDSGGIGGGAGDTGSGAGNGASGTGGGGGGGKYFTSDIGGNGATGSEFDGTHGSGGGGGGGGGRNGALAGNGGTGANYGGGGGGGGYPQIGAAWGAGGAGGDGIIVVTYTPVASGRLTAECWAPFEAQTTQRKDELAVIEFGLTVPNDNRQQVETRSSVGRGGATPIGISRVASGDTGLSGEWGGAVAVAADALLRLEAAALLRAEVTALGEFICRIVRLDADPAEWLYAIRSDASKPNEIVAVLSQAALPALELLTGGTRISADGLLTSEWADPPALLMVSPERLIRSPGRIRIVATADSMHPLRGQ
jgi:hypothetical protein